jgi:hypothetical protein
LLGSALETEEVVSSETFIHLCYNTQCHIAEDSSFIEGFQRGAVHYKVLEFCSRSTHTRLVIGWNNAIETRKVKNRLWWGEGSSGSNWAHAVSCRLPTAAARVQSQVRSCGMCGGQIGIGAGVYCVPYTSSSPDNSFPTNC